MPKQREVAKPGGQLELARKRRRAILERTRVGREQIAKRAAGADMRDLEHLPVFTLHAPRAKPPTPAKEPRPRKKQLPKLPVATRPAVGERAPRRRYRCKACGGAGHRRGSVNCPRVIAAVMAA